MRTVRSLTRGLPWALALLIAAPAALSAPAKRHKPKHAAAAADSAAAPKDPAPSKPDDSPATKPSDDSDAKPDSDAKLDAKPAPKSDDAPDTDAPLATPSLAASKSAKNASDSPSAPSEPEHDERDSSDSRGDAALGRREAARLAAGRIEVAATVSAGIGSRHFTYSDPVGNLLAPYRLPVAPMATFGLEAYPLASTNVPVLRDFGFRGHISRAFAVDSTTPQGVTIDTSWTRYGGDVRERVLVPGPHAFELGLEVGAEVSNFGMSTKTQVAALLPAARTVSVRIGFDTRLLLTGRFSALLGGGYLANTARGEIYDHFRDPHVAGIDADLGFALGLLPGLEARLTSLYTRYFASFKPKLGDVDVAGGALDEQWQFGLGVRYAH